jgi:hypothetical protein
MSCPSIASLQNCSIPTSYIRPNEGVAIMPWVGSAALFAAHIISCVNRVFLKTYDRSQLLAISLATYAVSIIILAYQSTHFDPQRIYIWTPLMLGIDVAALLHVIKQQLPDQERTQHRHLDYETVETKHLQQNERNYTDIFWTIVAALLVLTLIGLQMAGLVFSASHFARRSQLQLQTSWCSPAFQLGNSTFNSECTPFPITQYESLGIACVIVEGDQSTWLGWTTLGLIAFLIMEFGESIVLFLPQLKNFRSKYHYHAPIVTTLTGIIVGFAFITVGWHQMKSLPSGISENRLGIAGGIGGDCAFSPFPGGLRGTIIAWCDGIFKGWSLYP